MRGLTAFIATAALWLVASAMPTAFLEAVRWAAGAPFAWDGLAARWGLVLGVLVLGQMASPRHAGGTRSIWPAVAVGMVVVGTGLGALYVLAGVTWPAWGMVVLAYAFLMALERYLATGQRSLRRWAWRGFLAVMAGGFPTALSQIESRFSDEEFFVILQAAALAIFWLLLLLCQGLLTQPVPYRSHVRVHRRKRWVAVVLLLLVFAGSASTIRAYQRSFYPPDAPSYRAISPENPLLCGEVAASPESYDGEEIFRRLLALVEKHPHKGSPEYGMLALATGEQRWADSFHQSLLQEALEERFAGPAHSVKSVQYEAALRAYYYPRMRSGFPGLFSEDEIAEIERWFAAINRRALTVEWVDLMYALAFSKWPEGPYENQENGAGLLALLESEGLNDPRLSSKNQDYLARNRRGWEARFRVTDDAIVYQPEWIHNAYFQSLYTRERDLANVRLSLEWLLAQSLPDGWPLQYNYPANPSAAGTFYAGACWLKDPRLLWLAGRAVDALERAGRHLPAQPGVEEAVQMTGKAPSSGSGLLYGDSGLPNQIGPLAPDKIVFRDSWSTDSAYLLLNLRFSGWHRYKATNTVTLVYQDGPLAADVLEGERFAWLPVGRSLFRDKRIPRENLNGLVVERTGMGAILYGLSGVGGPWAQDPPYYADVQAVETAPTLDWSHTRLTDWHGWQHDRWIYFYRASGPIIVADAANGPRGQQAALIWHLSGEGAAAGQRFWLRRDESPAEVLLLAAGKGAAGFDVAKEPGGNAGQRVVYYAPTDGRLRLVTVFLMGHWLGADVTLEPEEQTLKIVQGDAGITLPLPFGE